MNLIGKKKNSITKPQIKYSTKGKYNEISISIWRNCTMHGRTPN
jgi:putative lipoic acid-binding regulatory protein